VDATKDTILTTRLFVLPSLAGLTDEQVRGVACVWDGVVLTPATAVDLGKRTARRAGADVAWFPRACRSCVWLAAHTNLYTHRMACEQCVDNAAGCETGAALLLLMRKYAS
jgi:hypothetical protein